MRTTEFEASLRDARLYPQLWRLGLGLILIGFMGLSLGGMVVGGFVAVANWLDPNYTIHVSAGLRSIQNTISGYGGLDTPIAVFLLLISFVGLLVGPMLAAAAFHFRGPGSLFGQPRTWARGFLTALAVQLPILGVLLAIGAFFDPPQANLPLGRWILYVPLALPLILMQTAAEELVFRGYLQQQLAARFASRWIWMGLPAALFAALHYSPSLGPLLPVVMASALIFGLIAADLTARTGSLGAAMGLHFGNNVLGMLFVASGPSISGLALFVSPISVQPGVGEMMALGISTLIVVVIWRLTRMLLAR
ncbi:CPBP family intramembrane glutamic endopeptidase [Tropicimonas sp. IMCC34043]|uniref:CPBP family intramembrane glutamic endopeptidase n=1 Tax=Tropicimonas sp. IMCC34043 TaxID=2248760 RepID=UPI0013008F8D|nr:CPBP family intramembrane glutamic endopeptidase [Tropicimonas sp. IMCC34043]